MEKPLTGEMNNLHAYNLGTVFSKIRKVERQDIGDSIDGGLILRKLVEEAGYLIIPDVANSR